MALGIVLKMKLISFIKHHPHDLVLSQRLPLFIPSRGLGIQLQISEKLAIQNTREKNAFMQIYIQEYP